MFKDFEELNNKYEKNGLKERNEKKIEKMTIEELKEECRNIDKRRYIKSQKELQILDSLEYFQKQTSNIYKKINEEFQKNNIDRDLRDYIEKIMTEIHREINTIKEND